MTRKIIMNLAMSLDGYIADDNGGFDWIGGDGHSELDTSDQFSFPDFLEQVDTVVMGRKSFEDSTLDMVAQHKILVVTSLEKEDVGNVQFVKGDIVSHVQALQKEEGKDIWLFGGSQLTNAFLKAGIVDEFIIGIVPMILGTGVRLFEENDRMIPLQLEEYSVNEGLPILRYTKRA